MALASTQTASSATADLAALVDAHATLLFRVAHSVLRNRAEAEDVVQDTFLRALEKQPRLAGLREPRAWLVRIAWNLALDRRRRIRPDQMDTAFAHALIANETPADQSLDEARRIRSVLREIDRLPRKEREALLLNALEELSVQEIAAVLQRSESAVRALLFRARTRLRQRLEAKQAKKGASR